MAYDAKKIYYRFDDYLSRLVLDYEASRQIDEDSERLYHGFPNAPYDESLFEQHNVKRGLRNADGSGVVAGLTRISDVHGYNRIDGRVVPDEGRLSLRGYSIDDLVNHAQAEDRFGYEEVAYLLLTGSLPNKEAPRGLLRAPARIPSPLRRLHPRVPAHHALQKHHEHAGTRRLAAIPL